MAFFVFFLRFVAKKDLRQDIGGFGERKDVVAVYDTDVETIAYFACVLVDVVAKQNFLTLGF